MRDIAKMIVIALSWAGFGAWLEQVKDGDETLEKLLDDGPV